MKFVITLMLFWVAAAVAAPDQRIICSATLQDGKEFISTPTVELYEGLEAVRSTCLVLDGKKYVFSVKCSAFEQGRSIK